MNLKKEKKKHVEMCFGYFFPILDEKIPELNIVNVKTLVQKEKYFGAIQEFIHILKNSHDIFLEKNNKNAIKEALYLMQEVTDILALYRVSSEIRSMAFFVDKRRLHLCYVESIFHKVIQFLPKNLQTDAAEYASVWEFALAYEDIVWGIYNNVTLTTEVIEHLYLLATTYNDYCGMEELYFKFPRILEEKKKAILYRLIWQIRRIKEDEFDDSLMSDDTNVEVVATIGELPIHTRIEELEGASPTGKYIIESEHVPFLQRYTTHTFDFENYGYGLGYIAEGIEPLEDFYRGS